MGIHRESPSPSLPRSQRDDVLDDVTRRRVTATFVPSPLGKPSQAGPRGPGPKQVKDAVQDIAGRRVGSSKDQ